MEPASGRRVLIIAPNWIGDAMMAAALIGEIKHRSPTHVTAMAPAAVAAVLRLLPDIDEVIETEWPHGGLQFFARLRLGRRLAGRFDAAFILPNSFKSALVPWFAGIPQRIGYSGEARRGLLTRCLQNAKKRTPMREHYLALAPADGPRLPATRAQITLASGAVARATERFGIDGRRPLAVFCPGAEFGPAKRWPAEHFAALAQLLIKQRADLQIALVGGPHDVDTANAIVRMTPIPLISTVGMTRIDEAAALLAAAEFVVTNDSGLMHVAAALDRPQAALFGSTDPTHTPPQSDQAKVLWLHLSCSPCFARTCPLGHLRCLNELTPESVFAAIDRAPVH